MKWLCFVLLSLGVFADEGDKWAKRWFTVTEVVEKHEGYKNGDVINRPPGTWQLLYGVIRAESAPAGLSKDCLWIRVPKQDDGELRISSTTPSESCAGNWEKSPVIKMEKLKTVQSSQEGNEAKLWLTTENGRVIHWKARFLNKTSERAPQLFDSSAKTRAYPGVFFFNPRAEITAAKAQDLLGDLKDEYPQSACSYKNGTCQRCRWGVYKVAEDYFCGVDRCGEKNRPACPRGIRWQRTRAEFSCRQDDSYVYCGPDLKVECEGERAICR